MPLPVPPLPKPPPRPVLLLAHGGFVVRNLLLGTFAERVMMERPLLAAVLDPSDPELLRRFAGRPIRFLTHETEPGRDLRLSRRCAPCGRSLITSRSAPRAPAGWSWPSGFTTAATPGWATARRALLKGLGFALQRLRLLGPFESFYLERARRWPITLAWRTILEREWPSVVVSSMLTLAKKFHPSVDLPPLLAAHDLGIPCGMLVQSWDNLSTKMGVLPVWLDRYWTWSPRMSSELGELYPHLPRERFAIVGSPQFDFHRRRELRISREAHAAAVGLDPARPYVLVGTGTPKALPEEHLVVADLARRLAAVRPERSGFAAAPSQGLQRPLGLRWPPSSPRSGVVLRPTRTDRHVDEGGVVSPFDFYRDQVNDLGHAEVVVNCSSTLTVDAALLDKPVVCLAYDPGPDRDFPGRPGARLRHRLALRAFGRRPGVSPWPKNPEAALAAVLAYLGDPGLHREAGPASSRW